MHNIGTLIGLFGILKYVLDRAMVDNIRKFQEAVRLSLLESSKLGREEQSRIALDVGKRVWSLVVDDPAKRNVTLFSRIGFAVSSFYCYTVPVFLQWALWVPAAILTYPVRFVIDKNKLEAVRAQTRKMAVEGLWSFVAPMMFAVLTASVLVQEVQYVRVINGEGPAGPEINKHTVKRVVIGPGRFSFSLPHHPIIYGVSYLLVLFAVFHTISFFIILANYEERD